MKKIFFSASTLSFYPEYLRENYTQSGSWPLDALELSDSEVSKYQKKSPPTGYILSADSEGRPMFDEKSISINQLIINKQSEIIQKFKLAMSPVSSLYTTEEIASFPTQEPEAMAWQADNTAPTPLLDGLLAERTSIDKPTLVQRIIDNSAAYKLSAGPAIGKKQHFEDLLYALKTQHEDPEQADLTNADIDSIVVDFN